MPKGIDVKELLSLVNSIKTSKTAIVFLIACIVFLVLNDVVKVDEKYIGIPGIFLGILGIISFCVSFLLVHFFIWAFQRIVVFKNFVVNKWAKYKSERDFRILVSKERKKHIDVFISNISECERRFLQIFFSKEVVIGTIENGGIMERDTYGTGNSLADKRILATFEDNNSLSYKLEPDVIKKLEKKVFQKKVKRSEIKIGFDQIAGIPGGGGAQSSNFANKKRKTPGVRTQGLYRSKMN